MSDPVITFEKGIKARITSLLTKCTVPQQTMFFRMYGSIKDMPMSKTQWAIQQIERTLAKNNKESINA